MYTLLQIAEIVDGVVKGDDAFEVSSLKSLPNSGIDALSFCVDPAKNPALQDTNAGAVMLAPAYEDYFPGNKILVKDPYLAYARISSLFLDSRKLHETESNQQCDSNSDVSHDAKLGENVVIGAFTTIGCQAEIANGTVIGNGVRIGNGVKIGSDCRIEDNVVISSRVVIGDRCYISPGAVVGSNGFGYAQDGEAWQRIEQLGRVLIGDNVDIGANTTIDRGALGDTIIGDGVKLDNQIQIAHNVEIGENTAIAGCVGIAGSAKIGKRCKIAGRAAILGHLNIADDVTILVNSTVTKSITQKGEYGSMIPVQTIAQWRKNLAIIRRLDKIFKGRDAG